jgi:hypothetical protein
MADPDWQETILGDVLTVKHGHAFKGKYFGVGGGVRLVTPGNFFERGGFRDRGADQKSYDGPVVPDYHLEPGSLVVAMTEQAPGLLGSAGLVPEDEFTWLHNQRIGLVLVRHGLADKDFIRYLLNSHAVREQLAATATGTKVRHTAPSRIEAVRTSLPSYWLQQRTGRSACWEMWSRSTAACSRRTRFPIPSSTSTSHQWGLGTSVRQRSSTLQMPRGARAVGWLTGTSSGAPCVRTVGLMG